MDPIEAEALRIRGDVLQAEEMRLVTVSRQQLRHALLLGVKLPTVGPMCETHNAVGVGKAPGRQRGPAWAALGRDAEGPLESKPIRRKRIQMRCGHGRDPVAAEMAAEVVAGNEHDEARLTQGDHARLRCQAAATSAATMKTAPMAVQPGV